jgi:hypothetical protein
MQTRVFVGRLKSVLVAALTMALAAQAVPAHAAGFTVQSINSPGPAIRMSSNGRVTGFYVAKCTTLSSQPKRTICYNAPWLFDGQHLAKLANQFPANTNAKPVAVNDAGELIGANIYGPWFYSNGAFTSVSASLVALNNSGVAAGMGYVSSVYQPVTYRFGGAPVPILSPGYVVVDINDAGMMAGWFRNGANVEQAFIADAAGTIYPVPSLDPAVNCRPVRISQVSPANGVWVAGNCAGNRPFRFALGDPGPTELRFAGSSNLTAVSVNSRGEVAGTAVRPGAFAPDGYTALLWSSDPVNPIDLNANAAFAPAGAWNVHATDINDAGTVLTGYNDISGNFYTFLLHLLP